MLARHCGLRARFPRPNRCWVTSPATDFHLATYEESLGVFPKAGGVLEPHQAGERWQDHAKAAIGGSPSSPIRRTWRNWTITRKSRGGWRWRAASATSRRTPWRTTLKPFIHIDGGLHASEVANHQHTIQLGYDLVASEEPEFKAIRQNLIVELWFSINPDGQSIVANWYRQNVGTPYEVSPVPVLYQEYVGHDNNRDGYMLNMLEIARGDQGHARNRAAGLLHASTRPRRSRAASICRPSPIRFRVTCTR